MIDSHALVGSCGADRQARASLRRAQIGGVLEPVGNLPVVIEDDVVVGGNCGIYEGTMVRSRAVIGAASSSPAPRRSTTSCAARSTAARRQPLEIPFGAVVIPGSRPMRGAFAEQHGLSVATPVIVKYRDEKTDAGTALEDALR
jgi:2,3,4,5-tetrahydropyridine-2-carboxylate N-succinyltransferase